MQLIDQVKPTDINIKSDLMGSEFRNSEKETIAKNIIIFSRKNSDQWLAFTFEQYMKLCGHRITESGRTVLNELVVERVLTCYGGRYKITNSFIAKLFKFVELSHVSCESA